jgi:hypothetical protein
VPRARWCNVCARSSRPPVRRSPPPAAHIELAGGKHGRSTCRHRRHARREARK